MGLIPIRVNTLSSNKTVEKIAVTDLVNLLDKVQGHDSAFKVNLGAKVYTMNADKQESLVLGLGHLVYLNQIGSYLPAEGGLPIFDCFLAICPVKEDVHEMKNSLFY